MHTSTSAPLLHADMNELTEISQENASSTEVVAEMLNAVTLNTPNDVSLIAKLHNEILLKVFQIAVELDRERSPEKKDGSKQQTLLFMKNIRNFSQVNYLWRNLIINESLLWADHINIDYLGSISDEWRGEIIRRTKDSPLNVKGPIDISLAADPDDSDPWWKEFLDDNWSRIRRVELDMISSDIEDVMTQNNWKPGKFALNSEVEEEFQKALPFLSRSAPTLEHFSLSFPYCMCNPLEPGRTFFDNRAPRLTFFEIRNIQFKHRASWLHQLQGLSILGFEAGTFKSGDEACQALSTMPNLESLSLKNAITDPSVNVHQDFIHLPRLQYLSIHDVDEQVKALLRRFFDPSAAATYWPVLSRIIPKPGCSVILNLAAVYSCPGKTDIRVLSRLAQNYFQINRPTKLDIFSNGDSFNLWDGQEGHSLSSVAGRQPQAPIFHFACSFALQQGGSHLDRKIHQAFEAFFEISFSTVTHLRLELTVPVSPKSSLLSCPGMTSLLSTFSSVETLTTNVSTLKFLSDSPAINISTIFPKLKVLSIPVRLGGGGIISGSWQFRSHSIGYFIAIRAEEGLVPLPTVEYISEDKEIMDDLSPLDLIAGLKVVWKTKTIGDGEYICGSGKPEELDFRRKWGPIRSAGE